MRTRRMLRFPSPRNPGLPGLRIIVRKSGKPDLRWGGVRGGGRAKRQSQCLIASPPSPSLPHKGHKGGGGPETSSGAHE